MEKQLKQSVKNASKQQTVTLLQRRENLQQIIEDATNMLATVNDELLVRATKEGGKITVNGKTVSVIKRLSFTNVPLEVAKKFRAVKKVVDPKVLKPLYEKGITIEGATYTEYVAVREVKE